MSETWNKEDNYAAADHLHDDKYSKLGHVHDYAASDHNHDDVYSKLGHSHELIDMLPVGTVLWFGQDVTLSSKWTVCTDLIGRYPLGATSGIGNTVEAGLPNITGTFSGAGSIANTAASVYSKYSGAFYIHTEQGGTRLANDASAAYDDLFGFDASKCSSVYKDSCTTVTPASMKLIPYIKIA